MSTATPSNKPQESNVN